MNEMENWARENIFVKYIFILTQPYNCFEHPYTLMARFMTSPIGLGTHHARGRKRKNF